MKRLSRALFVVVGVVGMLGSYLITAAYAKDKVRICHKPGTADEKELLVPESAVKGHLGHGDVRGSCGKIGR